MKSSAHSTPHTSHFRGSEVSGNLLSHTPVLPRWLHVRFNLGYALLREQKSDRTFSILSPRMSLMRRQRGS